MLIFTLILILFLNYLSCFRKKRKQIRTILKDKKPKKNKKDSNGEQDSLTQRDIDDEEFMQNLRRKMSINSGDGGSSSDGGDANDLADAIEGDIVEYTRLWK